MGFGKRRLSGAKMCGMAKWRRRRIKSYAKLGPELLINPRFDDGATGWVSVAVSKSIAKTENGEGWQIFDTEVGESYQFQSACDRQGVSPSISVKQNNETGISLFVVHPDGTDWKGYGGKFVATTLTAAVHIGNGSNTALFDNFSVRKILV